MDETPVKPQVQQNTAADQSEPIITQPPHNGILPHTAQAPALHSDRLKDSGEASVTDSLSSNDDACLLPNPKDLYQTKDAKREVRTIAHLKQPSSTSSTPLNTDSAHIKEAPGGDCCARCLLACLFCELTSLCSALAQCLLCGGAVACADLGGACCCSDALMGCCCLEVGCTEECAIVETCCGSNDCLEICLECCAICFPS